MTDVILTKITDDAKVVSSVEKDYLAVKNVDDYQVQIVTKTNPLYASLQDQHVLSGNDFNYVFTQSSASNYWTVNHNLSKYCSVTIVDDYNQVIYGDVQFNSLNQLTIHFEAALTGKAYCN